MCGHVQPGRLQALGLTVVKRFANPKGVGPAIAAELNVGAGQDAVNRWALLRVKCTHLLRESTNRSRLHVRPSPRLKIGLPSFPPVPRNVAD